MFALCAARTCDPRTVPEPCIPFLCPDDGCWARAHEMFRLMIAAGQQPGKIWNYGRLFASTRNNPRCAVSWGYHVAATLSVDSGNGPQTVVIDPSLFPTPVADVQWRSVQGDPRSSVALTNSSVDSRRQSGSFSTDPNYKDTILVLAQYRSQLRLRSAGPNGPPPYVNCP